MIRFAHPIREKISILFDQFTTAIGGASINDNPFVVFKSL